MTNTANDVDDNFTEEELAAVEKYFELMKDGSTEERLERMERKVDALDVKLTNILTIVDDIMGQAKPVIEQISNSPMVKMLTGGK